MSTIVAPRLEAKSNPNSPDERSVTPWKRFRYRAEALFLAAVLRAVLLLPRQAVLAMGRAAGLVCYALFGEDRRVAYANLGIVFGDTKSRREKGRIVRSAFKNLGSAMLGLAWAPRLNPSNFRRWIDASPETEANLRTLRESGRGVVFVTAHYGDWEMGSLATAYLGSPFMGVAEPMRNPTFQDVITRLRTSAGHTTIPPRFAAVKLFRHLSRGGAVAVIADVNGRRGRGGVWLDFFGLPVFNGSAGIELALRTNAAVVFGYGKPLPGGRVELVIEKEMVPIRTGDRDADVLAMNQRCVDRCAELIREHPEWWLWTYKRWKRRPTPERGKFPFYSKYDPKT